MKAIRHRFHRSAYGQGIQVVIQKDHQTQTPGGQQTPSLGLNAFNQRTPKRVGATAFYQEPNKTAVQTAN